MMCIYKIVNVLNKKEYVGSAKSFRKRKNSHLLDLRRKKHHSIKLQNSWNKHGEHNFEFIIIEEISNQKELIIREQFWIDTLNPFFNISKIAGSPLGVKHTKQARENMRKSHLGKKLKKESIEKRSLKQSGENHWTKKPKNKKSFNKLLKSAVKIAKSRIGTKQSEERVNNRIKQFIKPVFQFSIDGVFIKEWNGGAKEINKVLGVSINSIRRCCKGVRRKTHGYMWSYKNEPPVMKVHKNFNPNKKTRIKRKKEVIQLDNFGNIIKEFSSITEASKSTLIHINSISMCCLGKTNTAGGFKWKYKKDII